MNERDKLLRKSRRTKLPSDIINYRQKRNAANIAIRRAKSTYYKDLLKENAGNPNKFWKTLKSIYPTKSKRQSPTQSFQVDGKTLTDSQSIANAFCSFFADIIPALKKKAIPLVDFVWRKPANTTRRTENAFNFKPVTTLEVECQIKAVKRSKATGSDDLPPGMLKDSATVISGPLTYIINLSLATGIFPVQWKSAKIIPIYKSGVKSNLENYRPISILPAISKIIEKIVHKQLMAYLQENKLLSPFQFGFQPRMSTELAATVLLDNIRKHVEKGSLVGAIFIDLSKAFDTISHAKLLQKLHQYGINDEEHSWFADYLFNRTAKVSFNNCTSQVQHIMSGVPQGSIIGPLLFVIFYNDIIDAINTSNIIKYADDTVVYVADKDVQEINLKLSKVMDDLGTWLDENELVLNLKKGKTEALLFGTAKRLGKADEALCVFYKGKPINVATSYKYLEVELDSSLNLNSNFNATYKRASGRLRLLGKLRNYLDLYSAKIIYNSMVLPTLTYCGILNLKQTATQLDKLFCSPSFLFSLL